MEKRVIGLIAAMPEEINPFLKAAGVCSREKIVGFEAWRFGLGTRLAEIMRRFWLFCWR